jgi:hypothetical protein
MGDLNSHAKTSPVLFFTDNGMIDLHRAFHADSSYSYMFGGKASYIDHALCNSSLYGQITGVAGYHINSDEDDRYTYDKSTDRTMFRCSDHDPVMVGLKLDSTLSRSIEPYINNGEVLSLENNRMIIQHAYSTESKSYYAIYTINGLLQTHGEITSSFQEVPLPDTPGVYIVYLYYKGGVYPQRLIVR